MQILVTICWRICILWEVKVHHFPAIQSLHRANNIACTEYRFQRVVSLQRPYVASYGHFNDVQSAAVNSYATVVFAQHRIHLSQISAAGTNDFSASAGNLYMNPCLLLRVSCMLGKAEKALTMLKETLKWSLRLVYFYFSGNFSGDYQLYELLKSRRQRGVNEMLQKKKITEKFSLNRHVCKYVCCSKAAERQRFLLRMSWLRYCCASTATRTIFVLRL